MCHFLAGSSTSVGLSKTLYWFLHRKMTLAVCTGMEADRFVKGLDNKPQKMFEFVVSAEILLFFCALTNQFMDTLYIRHP
jgi:hypothetical protein